MTSITQPRYNHLPTHIISLYRKHWWGLSVCITSLHRSVLKSGQHDVIRSTMEEHKTNWIWTAGNNSLCFKHHCRWSNSLEQEKKRKTFVFTDTQNKILTVNHWLWTLTKFVQIFGYKIFSHMGQAFNKYQWECARNKQASQQCS